MASNLSKLASKARLPFSGLVLLASATLLSPACGDDSEDGGSADALEASCNAFCDKVYGDPSCPSPNLTLEDCKRVCPAASAQLGGYCVQEHTDAFECIAAGGITCSENGPIPVATCPEENQALLTCQGEAACDRFCNTVDSSGCAPGGSADACTEQCNALRADLGLCASRYELYLQCATSFGVGCVDGEPFSAECDEDQWDVGSCVASVIDPCQGYCFNFEAIGCGDAAACESTCTSERDSVPACAETHSAWVTCVAEDWEATCGPEGLVSLACDVQRQEYTTCTGGGT
jgi:hypothetical protein